MSHNETQQYKVVDINDIAYKYQREEFENLLNDMYTNQKYKLHSVVLSTDSNGSTRRHLAIFEKMDA
jgi:hypothetical protein